MVATPKGSLFKNALLALATVVLMLVLFELALRFHGHLENRGILSSESDLGIEPPAEGAVELGHMIRLSSNRRIIYELKPNLDVVYAGARVRTNPDGLRGSSSLADLQRASYRVVGLGDSFMFGFGVEDDQPYLAQVEKQFRERAPKLGLRIANMAVPGYNTAMEVETLREKVLAARPQVVIIEFVGNDLRLPNFIRPKNAVLSFDRFFLERFVRRRLQRRRDPSLFRQLNMGGLESGLEVDRVPPEYRDMVGFPSYVRTLRGLQGLSREYDFQVVSITLAEPNKFHRQVMGVSDDLGFHVLDIGTYFEKYLEERGHDQYLGSPLSLSASDGHPSVLGHRVAAAALHRFLRNEIVPVQ